MATINRNGTPTKSTKGSIGDTYHDLSSGKSYQCVSIFRDSLGSAEYEWEYISDIDIPEQKAPEENVSTDSSNEKPTVEDTPERPVQQNQNRTNNNYRKQYNKQYNKQHKN